jgi:hypothetical protein
MFPAGLTAGRLEPKVHLERRRCAVGRRCTPGAQLGVTGFVRYPGERFAAILRLTGAAGTRESGR